MTVTQQVLKAKVVNKTSSERFRSLMKAQNISYEKLALILNKTTMTVFNWIKNPEKLSIEKMVTLCRALNIDPAFMAELIMADYEHPIGQDGGPKQE